MHAYLLKPQSDDVILQEWGQACPSMPKEASRTLRFQKLNEVYWDTSTSSQVSNYDGVLLEIYLDHKFQWPQGGLNCKSLIYKMVT